MKINLVCWVVLNFKFINTFQEGGFSSSGKCAVRSVLTRRNEPHNSPIDSHISIPSGRHCPRALTCYLQSRASFVFVRFGRSARACIIMTAAAAAPCFSPIVVSDSLARELLISRLLVTILFALPYDNYILVMKVKAVCMAGVRVWVCWCVQARAVDSVFFCFSCKTTTH